MSVTSISYFDTFVKLIVVKEKCQGTFELRSHFASQQLSHTTGLTQTLVKKYKMEMEELKNTVKAFFPETGS